MANPPKPNLLLEFVEFANQTGAAKPLVPFADLPKHMTDNGWAWRARQTNAQLGAQTVLIDYEISIGKLDALDRMTVVDTISMGVPLGVFNASMSTRINLGMSAMYLLFDRLPPPPPAAAVEPVVPGPPGERPMTDAEVAEARARRLAAQPPQPAPAPNGHDPAPTPAPAPIAEVSEDDVLPDVIDGYLKSGMPLFKDVDAIRAPSDDVIEAMLFATEDAIGNAKTADQLVEFYQRNERKMAFVNELGTPDQIAKLKTMLSTRSSELAGTASDPPVRRRIPAA